MVQLAFIKKRSMQQLQLHASQADSYNPPAPIRTFFAAFVLLFAAFVLLFAAFVLLFAAFVFLFAALGLLFKYHRPFY